MTENDSDSEDCDNSFDWMIQRYVIIAAIILGSIGRLLIDYIHPIVFIMFCVAGLFVILAVTFVLHDIVIPKSKEKKIKEIKSQNIL